MCELFTSSTLPIQEKTFPTSALAFSPVEHGLGPAEISLSLSDSSRRRQEGMLNSFVLSVRRKVSPHGADTGTKLEKGIFGGVFAYFSSALKPL